MAMREEIGRIFDMPVPMIWKVMEAFHLDMDKGLAGEESSLKMIPTYVGMPTGGEKGDFIALDLGGTNFRVLKLTLKGGGKALEPVIMKFALEKKQITGTAEIFFDFIADSVGAFLEKNNLSGKDRLDLGFTFSFPIRQTGIASGILMCWTKGFETTGVVGNDVVKLMNEAFARKRIENVKISALVNDTVGTLIAKSYEDPDCDAGVIIGTGTNACYPEELTRIKKWPALSGKKGRMIINIEWGNFDKLISTSYDRQLDEASENPGQQILEKMVSGMYLGEVARLVLNDMSSKGEFASVSIPGLLTKGGFGTEYMSDVEADVTRGLDGVGDILEKLGCSQSSKEDRGLFKDICGIVSCRAARISAACIAAIVTRMDPQLENAHTIAIDGSVFEKHPTFAANMRRALGEMFGVKASLIRPVLAKDGSGKGAAITAAIAAKK